MSQRPLALFAGALALAAACTKSAGPQETAASVPGPAVGGEKIAPPPGPGGEKIAPPGGAGGGTAVPPQTGPDASFDLKVEAPAAVAPGAEAVARVTVTPGNGYKINEEYPSELRLEPPAGVTIAKPVLGREEAAALDKHQLVFAVKLTPSAAGSFAVGGTIKFAVCTSATCDPKKRAVEVALVAR